MWRRFRSCYGLQFRKGLRTELVSCPGTERNLSYPSRNFCTQRSVSTSTCEKGYVRLEENADGSPYILTKEDEEYVTMGDNSQKKKLDTLLMDLFVRRQKGTSLPDQVSLDILKEMMTCSSNKIDEALRRQLIQQRRQIKDAKKKMEQQKEYTSMLEGRGENRNPLYWMDYRLFGNALFQRVFTRSMQHFYNFKMDEGRRFGQNVVFDCSYSQNMRECDIKNTAKQLTFCLHENRMSRRPFALHFCNFEKSDSLSSYMNRIFPSFEDDIPITMTSENYTDLFHRKNLVYLSPDAKLSLQYNPDDVYIIGAIVDKVDKSPLSMSKARKEGIRVARLPLEKYVKWEVGEKSLCLHQVLRILLDVKNTGNWQATLLENIPPRKLRKKVFRK